MSDSQDDQTIVLVVEDEMVLRMRAVDIVEDAGFTALEAINADQALAILEQRSDISLLFSDIQMPGSMDGLKLAFAVHDRWPDIKIILVSGRVNPSTEDKPAESRFFGKPIESEQMIAQLREMVGDGALKVVPKTAIPLAVEALTRNEAGGKVVPTAAEETLTAENDSLRLLLEQAVINAEVLLAQSGIDAKEREAADKLQKLILEELHHRIKNTLATVSAIASQSLRTADNMAHAQQAIEGRLQLAQFGSDGLPAGRKAPSTHGSARKMISTGTRPPIKAKTSPLRAISSTRSMRPAPTFCAAIDETDAPSAMAGIWI